MTKQAQTESSKQKPPSPSKADISFRFISVLNRPYWSIMESSLVQLSDVARKHDAFFLDNFFETRDPNDFSDFVTTDTTTGIATVSINKTIANGVDGWVSSFFSDCTRIRKALKELLDNQKITTIVLDIDSPGGTVDGVSELANFIYNSRSKKNIIAITSGYMASAAYWIGAAATTVYATRTSWVGSIGVLFSHYSTEGMDQNIGIAFTNLKTGKWKDLGTSIKNLDEQSTAKLQGEIGEIFDIFASDISKFRGLSIDEIKGFEADLFLATKASGFGLVDEILEDVDDVFSPEFNKNATNGGDVMAKTTTTKKIKAEDGSTDFSQYNDEAGCKSANGFWYDGACHEKDKGTSGAASDFSDKDACEGAGFYWYDGKCNTTEKSSSVSMKDFNSLSRQIASLSDTVQYLSQRVMQFNAAAADFTDKESCEDGGFFWYDGKCNASLQKTEQTSGSASENKTEEECKAAGFYWYDAKCNEKDKDEGKDGKPVSDPNTRPNVPNTAKRTGGGRVEALERQLRQMKSEAAYDKFDKLLAGLIDDRRVYSTEVEGLKNTFRTMYGSTTPSIVESFISSLKNRPQYSDPSKEGEQYKSGSTKDDDLPPSLAGMNVDRSSVSIDKQVRKVMNDKGCTYKEAYNIVQEIR